MGGTVHYLITGYTVVWPGFAFIIHRPTRIRSDSLCGVAQWAASSPRVVCVRVVPPPTTAAACLTKSSGKQKNEKNSHRGAVDG